MWIAFIFTSDDTTTDKGAFVDDVVLRKYVTGGEFDLVALETYLSTQAGDTEKNYLVDVPTVGQEVYFHFKYQCSGSGTTPSLRNELKIDGTMFCYVEGTAEGGYTYWNWCTSPWTATGGSHTLTGIVDVYNTVSESNETNNQASKSWGAPTVTTNNATNITTNSATLNGNLNNLGTASTVYVSFEYGLTTAYGSETTPQLMTTTGPFNFPLTGLSPNTTHHFRAKAVGDGTSYGLDKSFTTSGVGAVVVSIVPSNQTVYPGGSFNINVIVDSAGIPITACNVIVTFDTDLVATGLTGADLLGTFGLDALYLPTIDMGEAGYGGVRTDGPIAVNGNFVTINFDVDLAATGTYPLVVDATLNDAGGNPIGVFENNGQVNIGTNGIKGDFDGDGDIDFFDFYQFASAYGSELGDHNYNAIGDFDDDGDVDFLDFYSFAGVYGT